MRNILGQKISKELIQKQSDQLIQNLEAKESDSLHYLYQIYAYWLYDYVGKSEAINYEQRAFDFSKERDSSNISFIQRSGTYLAYYQVKNNEIPQSIKTYKEVILLDNSSKHATTSYFKLGYSYLLLRDYYQAIKHYELSIPLLKKYNQLRRLREAYQNIASTYLRVGTLDSYKKGRIYGEKADSLVQLIPTSSETKYKLNYLLAQLHNREEDVQFEISKKYYDRAFEIVKKEKDTSKLITINLGYGILYQHQDIALSKKYQEKTLSLSKERNPFYAYQAYSNLSYLEAKKENITKAIELRHTALKTLVGVDFRSLKTNYDSIIKNTNRKTNLLHSFPYLADSYVAKFNKTKETKYLDHAIFYFGLADQLIDELQKNSTEFKSRLFWRRLSEDVYDKAIEACYLLGDQSRAFYFMEKNKSLLLMEDIQKQRFLEQLSSSNYLYRTQKKYQREKARLSSLLNNSKASILEKDSLRKVLIDLDINFESENRQLLQNTGSYKAQANIITLDSIVSTLENDETILEYHIVREDTVGLYPKEEAIYLLAVSKDKKLLFQLENPKGIKENVEALIEKIKRPFYTTKDQEEYLNLAYHVYQQLIPNEVLRENLMQNKARVIPHGFLSLLPFEALISNEKELRYLIQDIGFEYQYSLSFLSNIRQTNPKKIQYTSFAPVHFESQNLLTLPNSKTEVELLSKKYKGVSFLGDLATKKTFMEQDKSGILHLATHADTPDSIAPWIAFKEEKLYLDEIYGLSTPADLVVLSACNTNLGKEEAGEGVMSLGRGFFYAGAQSVLASLWNINDQSSTEVLSAFYTYTASGASKSNALRKAKLDYLSNHLASETAPYYWASFVVIGNNTPLTNPSHLNYWIIGSLIILALSILVLKRRKVF